MNYDYNGFNNDPNSNDPISSAPKSDPDYTNNFGHTEQPAGNPWQPKNDNTQQADSAGFSGYSNENSFSENPYSASHEDSAPNRTENTSRWAQYYTTEPKEQEAWRDPIFQQSQEVIPSAVYSPTNRSPVGYTAAYTTDKTATEPKPKKRGFWRSTGFIAICAIICAAVSATAAYLVADYKIDQIPVTNNVILGSTNPSPNPSSTSNETPTASGELMDPSDLYDMACTQVVGVNTSVTTNVFGQQSTTAVTGSGFVISEDGYIMTNYHVIEYAAVYGYELTVIFEYGESYVAEIVGYEIDNDIAILKIDATGLNAVTFGDSSSMRVGESVFAIGNPLGELTNTMTPGIISALDRDITTESNTTISMFQISAAVNSGNSGGPVYNQYGEVIGVVTAKYSDTGIEGLGFAIPINDAYDIAAEIITNGYVTGKAYLGITVQDVTESASQYYGFPAGAYVYSMEQGGAAANAGVKTGDVITALDDTDVTSRDTLKSALKEYTAGDSAKITVYRSGEYFTYSIVFDEAPPSNSGASGGNSGGSGMPGGNYGG